MCNVPGQTAGHVSGGGGGGGGEWGRDRLGQKARGACPQDSLGVGGEGLGDGGKLVPPGL